MQKFKKDSQCWSYYKKITGIFESGYNTKDEFVTFMNRERKGEQEHSWNIDYLLLEQVALEEKEASKSGCRELVTEGLC